MNGTHELCLCVLVCVRRLNGDTNAFHRNKWFTHSCGVRCQWCMINKPKTNGGERATPQQLLERVQMSNWNGNTSWIINICLMISTLSVCSVCWVNIRRCLFYRTCYKCKHFSGFSRGKFKAYELMAYVLCLEKKNFHRPCGIACSISLLSSSGKFYHFNWNICNLAVFASHFVYIHVTFQNIAIAHSLKPRFVAVHRGLWLYTEVLRCIHTISLRSYTHTRMLNVAHQTTIDKVCLVLKLFCVCEYLLACDTKEASTFNKRNKHHQPAMEKLERMETFAIGKNKQVQQLQMS